MEGDEPVGDGDPPASAKRTPATGARPLVRRSLPLVVLSLSTEPPVLLGGTGENRARREVPVPRGVPLLREVGKERLQRVGHRHPSTGTERTTLTSCPFSGSCLPDVIRAYRASPPDAFARAGRNLIGRVTLVSGRVPLLDELGKVRNEARLVLAGSVGHTFLPFVIVETSLFSVGVERVRCLPIPPASNLACSSRSPRTP